MGVDIYILRSPNKNFQAIGRNGKPVWVGQASWLCKAGDEDPDRYYDARLRRAANLLRGRITKAEQAYSAVARDWPRVAVTISDRRPKVKDGAFLIDWPEADVTHADCSWKDEGILRSVPGRDGSMNWVVFPSPTCRHCEDTGHAVSTISTSPWQGRPGMHANEGDICPWCVEGSHVAMAEAKYNAIIERRRAEEAQRNSEREASYRRDEALRAQQKAEEAKKAAFAAKEAAEKAQRAAEEAQKKADDAAREAYAANLAVNPR